MSEIGFTTGSLYLTKIPFDDRIKLYNSLGASAIELSFSTPSHLLNYNLTEYAIKLINKYKYVSMHAPWIDVKYNSNETSKEVIKKLEYLCKKLPIKGVVLHPDIIYDFKILEKSGLPFLLENMDKRKLFGTHPYQFKEFRRKYDFGFVLDVQHAYEQDSTMQLAKELLVIIGNRLGHLHISGNSKSKNHALVHSADNKDNITKLLKLEINAPKILEGIITGNIEEEIKEELKYIKKY